MKDFMLIRFSFPLPKTTINHWETLYTLTFDLVVMLETGEENQVWTQNLKFEAKKGSQHRRRLWIVSFNLSLRASYPLPGSGTFLSIWREMKQRNRQLFGKLGWSMKEWLDSYQMLQPHVDAWKGPAYQIIAWSVRNCQSYPIFRCAYASL